MLGQHLFGLVLLAGLFASVLCIHVGRDLNAPLLESYDYVICGGGISGLVTAMRLTEDPTVSVLVLEAGIPDHYEEFIQVPQFVGSDIGSQYDWNLSTVSQIYLDGAPRPMPQGKVLGGGSILNAMCWNRGGQDDYNSWEALGNPGWGWAGLLPYFMKSETYTPPPADIENEFFIQPNFAVHGTDGPVQVSYPKYFYNQSRNLFLAMNRLGLPTALDPNDGTTAGPSFVPTDIDPNNQTRSDARRTYYDPFYTRPNFHVMTGQHVTRVLFDGIVGNENASIPTTGGPQSGNGNAPSTGGVFGEGSTVPPPSRFAVRDYPAGLRANGVEFAPDASSARQQISATREVILACGSLHSAQLLQLSGVGPEDLLETYGIPVAIDLPGVGSNLQDHGLVGTFYPYNNVTNSPAQLAQNATYNELAGEEYFATKMGPWTAGSPNGLAFNSLPSISQNSAAILATADGQDPAEYLVSNIDPTVLAGYATQKNALVQQLSQPHNAVYEIINNNVGSLTVALMKPFSRGTCSITSSDPFQPPAIDPRYGSNPVDLQIWVETLLFNRQILATPEMVELQPAQFVPTVDADYDSLIATIKNGIRTEYHPSGTLAMMPQEMGGVVDSHLRVYGTQNVRCVDAGIFPIIPAAHLQAVVYAVAEKAADIIKADALTQLPVSSSSTLAASSSLSESVSTLVPSSSVKSTSISISSTPSILSSSSMSSSTTSTPASASVAVSNSTSSSTTSIPASATLAMSNTTPNPIPLISSSFSSSNSISTSASLAVSNPSPNLTPLISSLLSSSLSSTEISSTSQIQISETIGSSSTASETSASASSTPGPEIEPIGSISQSSTSVIVQTTSVASSSISILSEGPPSSSISVLGTVTATVVVLPMPLTITSVLQTSIEESLSVTLSQSLDAATSSPPMESSSMESAAIEPSTTSTQDTSSSSETGLGTPSQPLLNTQPTESSPQTSATPDPFIEELLSFAGSVPTPSGGPNGQSAEVTPEQQAAVVGFIHFILQFFHLE